jgi:hypothetical protein
MGKFDHTDEVKFKIPTSQYTSIQDFSALLYRIKALYTFIHEDSRLIEEERQYLEDILLNKQNIDNLDKWFVDEFKEEIDYVNFNSTRIQYFSKDLGEDDIYITEIENGSFIIALSGPTLATLLILALLATISGGKVSLGPSGYEFEAGKTLGESLKDLKEFFKK